MESLKAISERKQPSLKSLIRRGNTLDWLDKIHKKHLKKKNTSSRQGATVGQKSRGDEWTSSDNTKQCVGEVKKTKNR